MNSENKSAQPVNPIRRTNKTTDDFLRWWRERDVLKKKAVEEQIAQADHANSQALMEWSDDGAQIKSTGTRHIT